MIENRNCLFGMPGVILVEGIEIISPGRHPNLELHQPKFLPIFQKKNLEFGFGNVRIGHLLITVFIGS